MYNDSMNEDELKKVLANPYYAINLDASLGEEHEPIISEEDWVKANAKLIKEIGEEDWLYRLLDALRAKQ